MKKIIRLCLALFLALLCGAETHAETVTKKYEGDSSFTCGGKTYSIPTYFPYQKSYSSGTRYLKASCSKTGFEVSINLDKDCQGQHDCEVAKFTFGIIDQGVMGVISAGYFNTTKSFSLKDEPLNGFYLPSKCYAYCNKMFFLWFDNNKAYAIGSEFSHGFEKDTRELEQSVKSYLHSAKGN